MEIIYYLGVSHAIFGFALLIAKRPKHNSNIILAMWILSLGLHLSGRIIPVPVVSFFKPGLFPLLLLVRPVWVGSRPAFASSARGGSAPRAAVLDRLRSDLVE